MKSLTISFALFSLAGLSYAAPHPDSVEARQQRFGSAVTFEGAGPNPPTYTVSVAYDGSTFKIENPLSVSHIISDNTNAGVCTFHGIDGSITVLAGVSFADVGPPQQQVSGSCHLFNQPRESKAGITFIGAGPDPPTYFQQFPLDGSRQTISNPLSVSHISSSGGAVCNFFGIDGSNTFVAGDETVDVGPPQLQVAGQCLDQ